MYRDGFYLLESGKRILANNFIEIIFLKDELSTQRFLYLDNAIFDDETCNLGNLDQPCDTFSISSGLKLKNVNRLVIGHFNMNSLPGKFHQLKVVIKNNIDILIVTENKIHLSFSSSQ